MRVEHHLERNSGHFSVLQEYYLCILLPTLLYRTLQIDCKTQDLQTSRKFQVFYQKALNAALNTKQILLLEKLKKNKEKLENTLCLQKVNLRLPGTALRQLLANCLASETIATGTALLLRSVEVKVSKTSQTSKVCFVCNQIKRVL